MPFDAKIQRLDKRAGIPDGLIDAAVFVVDTMDLARAGAVQIFGDDATSDQVFAVYDRIIAKMSTTPKGAGRSSAP